MSRRLSILIVLSLLTLGTFAQTAAQKSLYNTFTDTYETRADSMTNAFIETFLIKEKGLFNNKYGHWAFNAYWQNAHAMNVVIYAYERYKGVNYLLANKYLNYMKLWYTNKGNNYSGASVGTTPAYKMFECSYTDDMCWVTLTMLHLSEATKNNNYAITAKNIFDNYIISRGEDDEETGGMWLPWKTGDPFKINACTLSPAALVAMKLYIKYGTAKYLEYAKKLYTYMVAKISHIDASKNDYRVEEPPLSYTQGTFAEVCRLLYHYSDESATVKAQYKNLAYQFLYYIFTSTRSTSGNNILRNEGTGESNCIFKAVLIPYAVNFVLDDEMLTSRRINISRLIQKNTQVMWKALDKSRYPLLFCNYDWSTTFTGEDSEGDMGATCCGASLMENTARMCKKISDDYNQAVADGLGAVTINSEPNLSGVFTLDGRLVRTPWQSTDNLPAGLYIINKKKVLIQ